MKYYYTLEDKAKGVFFMKSMEKGTQAVDKGNFKIIAKGSVIALLSTVILLFILSVVLTYSSLGENIIIPCIIVITAISIFIGSELSSAKIRKNGIVNGAMVGLIYIFVLYISSSILTGNFKFNLYSIILVVVSIVIGMAGRNNRSK
jgi:putative membrane protein (TIGR04086 family)